MEKVISVFKSFEEERTAELAYYASLTPQQRVDLLLEMVASQQEGEGEAGQRLERVLAVVPLHGS
jgi:hypothetical protein